MGVWVKCVRECVSARTHVPEREERAHVQHGQQLCLGRRERKSVALRLERRDDQSLRHKHKCLRVLLPECSELVSANPNPNVSGKGGPTTGPERPMQLGTFPLTSNARLPPIPQAGFH